MIRQYEVNRVTAQLATVWSDNHFTGQSNYSLTLGFVRDLNYWDPQNTPEDFHTGIKAYFYSNGGITQVRPIPTPASLVFEGSLDPGLVRRRCPSSRSFRTTWSRAGATVGRRPSATRGA